MSESEKDKVLTNNEDEVYQDALSATNEEIVDEVIRKHDQLCLDGGSDEEQQTGKINKENKEEIFVDCVDDDLIDENALLELDKTLTDEQKIENKKKAECLKLEGNVLFKHGNYEESIKLYTSALKVMPGRCSTERAILYANRAAAKNKIDSKKSAIDDCTIAIGLDDRYLKALLRRAKLYDETDKLDESAEDYKKVIELDPGNKEAILALQELGPRINERNEKLKEEMLGKLKDLGNMILKPFGLSTNNFEMKQNPGSEGYSINFKQNTN